MKKILICCAHDDFENKFKHTWSTLLVKDCFQDRIIEAWYFPVILPSLTLWQEMLTQLISEVDGIVFYGGWDIDPLHYGESLTYTNERYLHRDETELAVAHEAIKQKTPMIGFCRGHQLINVALWGTLYQDITKQCPQLTCQHMAVSENRELYAHQVTLSPWSKVHGIFTKIFENEPSHKTFSKTNAMLINSHHHQAIKDLGEGLTVTATSEDGIIESVEHATLPIIGIQRHPEYDQYRHPQSAQFLQHIWGELIDNK